jgi:RNA polymerase sigma-70 factor (ECF subfamily)
MAWFGTQRKVERLVAEFYEPLYRFGYRLSGSTQEAEDLTQETFCQAQRKLGQLRDDARARSWLFAILRNAYLHRLRAARHELRVPFDSLGEIPDRPTDSLPDIEPAQLQTVLLELPEPFRTPIVLYYFEEFSYREIADQMSVPLGTVMSRLARAKAVLRQRLLAPAAALAAEENQGREQNGLP